MVPHRRRWRIAALGTGIMVAATARAQAEELSEQPAPTPAPASEPEAVIAAEPWRIADAAGLDWLRFGLTQRTRYEHLFESFRRGRPGDGGLLSLRTHVAAELRPGPLRLGAELVDSRAYFGNEVTAPDTGIVNALSLLQAYLGVDLEDALTGGDRLRARVGRLTLDVGSRRLAARNGYRNTINGFTGLDLGYAVEDGPAFRLFAVMPVARRPDEPARVEDNVVELDRESTDVVFAGQHVTTPELGAGVTIEAYAFELAERDGDEATRDRRLFTPGVRVVRAREAGTVDVELETALQLGRSRATADPDDLEDLDHLASLQHVEVGYTLDVVTEPRVAFRYDQASGDADPRDGSNGRFDTLYGARRFEYGPTGIYGAFARSNVRTPGVVVELAAPSSALGTLDGFVGWRAFWLAQARDAWVTSGLRDPTGGSGTYLGHQLEAAVHYEPLPDNLEMELGVAHLFAGGFATSAPGANPETETTVLYAQVTSKL